MTAATSSRVEALVTQLGYIDHVLKENTSGLTHEDSLAQPQPGGNCLNWIVGHVVASRNQTLGLLGKDPIWDDKTAARYLRGSDPIAGSEDAVVPLEEMLAAFAAGQEAIVDALREISEEDLSEMVPWFGDEAPRAVALAGMIFHETYHVGQTGVLRRFIGKDSTI